MKLTKWIFLVFIIINQYSSANAQACYPNDSLALMRLYNGLGLSLTTPLHLLMPIIDTVSDPSISYAYYRISSINLNGLGAAGIIPDALFEGDSLNYLTTLNLSNNSIGAINGPLRYDNSSPAPNLQTINLSSNSFLPDPLLFYNLLNNLPSMTTLQLNNLFNGLSAAPLDYFVLPQNNLYELDVANNGLSDTLHLDTLLTYCLSLGSLSAQNNDFTAIKSPQSTSTPLAYIRLYNNDVQSFEDIRLLIENLSSLVFLEAFNVMDGLIPHDISNFSLSTTNHSLTELKLSANNLTGTLPITFFEQMDSIKTLYLSNNALTGSFPMPNLVTGGSFSGQRYYEGTGRLEDFDISVNNLSGNLPFDWLLTQQLVLYPNNNGGETPFRIIIADGNQFDGITPKMSDPIAIQALSIIYTNRFSSLESVGVSYNNLNFIDLYRTKKFLNFKQDFSGYNPHYVPLAGTDSTDFVYSNQDSIGIGGVKRRNNGDFVYLSNDLGLAEPFNGGTSYISSHYSWERLDTAGLAGGTSTAPVSEFIGEVYQNGASTTPNLVLVNGLSGTDPTYQVGANFTVDSAHYLNIGPLAAANHADWLYTAKITNDSFPLLELQTVPKKIEVGLCLDASGQPVNCQAMMIQYDPVLLASLSPMEQDSFKQAFRKALGGTPIDICLCGDMELLEISDTASTMLEGNSQGTKNAASSASAKPQLLSAGPNYGLLAGNNTSIPTNPIPSTGGNTTSKTVVAFIDSGLDYGYPSLHSHVSAGLPLNISCINNATWGYNFLDQTNNASDDHQHGTAVAGIIAGLNPNNLLPNTGVFADKISILPLKYTDRNGKGSLFHAACALRYAADYQRLLPNNDTAKVRVINTSWGFLGDPSDLLDDAIEYAGKECNILVVASAGNGGSITHGADSVRHWPSNSIFDPTNSIITDNVLAVAAINNHSANTLSSYSNFGNVHIDLAAQGKDSTTQAGSINGLSLFEGTSFAAPQVARAAALLFEKYPEASYFAIKAALIQGVDKLQSADSLKLKSGGRLNYYKADSLLNIMPDRTLCEEYKTINTQQIENTNNFITISPNPVFNQLNIDLDAILLNKKINLNIFNTQGQCLYHQVLEQGSNNVSIPTQDFPVGVYFIQLNIDEQVISKKFLKI